MGSSNASIGARIPRELACKSSLTLRNAVEQLSAEYFIENEEIVPVFPLEFFPQRGYAMAMSLINTEVDARDHTELKQYRVLDLCLAAKLLASWELLGSYNKLVPILDVFLSDAVMSSPAWIYHTTNDVPELQLTK